MRRRGLDDQRLAELLDRGETGVQPFELDDAVGRRLGARQRVAGIAHGIPRRVIPPPRTAPAWAPGRSRPGRRARARRAPTPGARASPPPDRTPPRTVPDPTP